MQTVGKAPISTTFNPDSAMSSSFVGGGQTSGDSGGAVDQVHYFQFTFLLHIQKRSRNKLRITLGANCCGSKVKGVYSSPHCGPPRPFRIVSRFNVNTSFRIKMSVSSRILPATSYWSIDPEQPCKLRINSSSARGEECAPQSVLEILHSAAETYPDHPALVEPSGKIISYS